jgi:hypothetical protein
VVTSSFRRRTFQRGAKRVFDFVPGSISVVGGDMIPCYCDLRTPSRMPARMPTATEEPVVWVGS